VVGRKIEDVEQWPDRIAKVTAADILKVARTYLDMRRSVTGTILPVPPDDIPVAAGQHPSKPPRS
jgi:zinc protease